MTVRLDSVSTQFPQGRLTLRAAIAATAFALAAATGAAYAQGGTATAAAGASAAASATAASGASAAQAALPVVGQYTVHPGQSLHDVAVDLTQSHDKTVLARASSALFDANPNAFMKHDPSRLKVGAVLNVPGTPDMASAGAASGVTAASAPSAAPAQAATASAPAAVTAPASAAASASAPNTAAATGATAAAASAVAAANAGASAATAATAATAGNAASSAATVASEPAGASAPETASAATAASASGASAALASGASAVDQHSFSGSVQAASAASAASAPVSVSSLQQLLALKNRVLMALQHGIGKPAQVAGGANGASGAHAPAGGVQAAQQPEVSPMTLGIVAAIVLAFVALLVRLLMRKRRKPAAADEAQATTETPVAPAAPLAGTPAHAEVDDMPVLDEPLTPVPAPTATVAAAAAGAAAYAQTHTEAEAAQPTPTLDHATDVASLSAAAELGGDALPPTLHDKLHTEANGPDALHEDRAEHGTHEQGVTPGEPETLADATDAASFAAASELGASALPPEGLAANTAGETEEHARRAEAELHAATESNQADEVDESEPAPFAPHAREPQPLELRMPGDPQPEPVAPAEPVEPAAPAVSAEESMPYQEVPQEFPKTAVDALGSIEMSLPPRVEVPDAPAMPDFPFSTEPSATPGATLGQALPFGQPPAPLAGQAIEAGTAGIGSIAGLGAPRFGTLSLDFDLNLPPDSAEPLPVFSPDQLARIARNKLDLAHEYIALGDLSGARALINEVIASSDAATRADAQALLSTLSPLS
ncbi:FimV-like protein [Paraburkholderia tropica]|uniref:FimV/HubP family polar landmark protein n=2 Tax=Paraburkholderia TaxID=1822464 RepID=UPI001CB589D2|nr:FimV/HubP family polar landmark protein [Paraburkholderia tropica]CAG9218108.1 FimV-like protein [Paraburkholderia tropica]